MLLIFSSNTFSFWVWTQWFDHFLSTNIILKLGTEMLVYNDSFCSFIHPSPLCIPKSSVLRVSPGFPRSPPMPYIPISPGSHTTADLSDTLKCSLQIFQAIVLLYRLIRLIKNFFLCIQKLQLIVSIKINPV